MPWLMTHAERIERVKSLSDRLHALMQEPEPGLMTWNDMVGDVLRELAKFAPSEGDGTRS